MKQVGFYLLKGITTSDASFMPCSMTKIDASTRVRSKDDDILDMIFCIDPITRFPCTSIAAYLSDKTADEVRTYIERNLLKDIPADQYPTNIREALNDIDTDFMVKVSRNQFETDEEYEDRVSGYLQELERDQEVKDKIAAFNEKLKKTLETD